MTATQPLSRLVLLPVGTSDEANLGAICRAMKNFGVSRLCVVAPRAESPRSARARALACSAEDILDAARIVPDLDRAAELERIDLFAATTARRSTARGPFLSPAEWAFEALPHLAAGRTIGLLLGREDRGLLNDEVDRCRWKISIPTGDDLTSLNLAQAAVVLLFTLWEAAVGHLTPTAPGAPPHFASEMEALLTGPTAKREAARTPASAEEFTRLLDVFSELAARTGYLWETNPAKSLRPFRQIFLRADLSRREVGILLSFVRDLLELIPEGAAAALKEKKANPEPL